MLRIINPAIPPINEPQKNAIITEATGQPPHALLRPNCMGASCLAATSAGLTGGIQ
jgi:hypothetical protein